MSQPLYPRRPQRRKTQKTRRIALLILVLLIVIAAAVTAVLVYRAQHIIIKNDLGLRNVALDQSLLETGGTYYSYQSGSEKVVSSVGIDVSTYQGTIDWQAVKNAGVDT